MYLLDALQQLYDLYEERIIVRCFSSIAADPGGKEEIKGYGLIYLWDGVPYYSAIWLACNNTLFWRLETDLHEAMRRGVPLTQLSDYASLIARTEDQGDWDVITPGHLAAYHRRRFDKEASNET